MTDHLYNLDMLNESVGIDRSMVKLFFFDNHDYFNAMAESQTSVTRWPIIPPLLW
jgi:hypothetical protein